MTHTCACGCGASLAPLKRYLYGHYAGSPEGRATSAKGGRNGTGAAKAKAWLRPRQYRDDPRRTA